MDSPFREGDGWKDGETSYVRVNVWHDLAEHVVDSLSKGDRVVVVGRLRTRAWETPEGDKRSVVGVEADEIGPSLRFATAKPQQTRELATATQGLGKVRACLVGDDGMSEPGGSGAGTAAGDYEGAKVGVHGASLEVDALV
jgi:single-strand DNA-binding protein